MKRSLIAFQALLASSAVLCQSAQASSTYTAPEQLNPQGQTIGVVKDTASAQVRKNVVPGATLKNFTTPKEALDALLHG